MRCPKCGLENPEGGIHCDCGYNFGTGLKEPKPVAYTGTRMKTCPTCHQNYPDDDEYCMQDGTKLVPEIREERECPYCAEPILKKARVCKHCGRDVEPLAKPETPAPSITPASPNAESPSRPSEASGSSEADRPASTPDLLGSDRSLRHDILNTTPGVGKRRTMFVIGGMLLLAYIVARIGGCEGPVSQPPPTVTNLSQPSNQTEQEAEAAREAQSLRDSAAAREGELARKTQEAKDLQERKGKLAHSNSKLVKDLQAIIDARDERIDSRIRNKMQECLIAGWPDDNDPTFDSRGNVRADCIETYRNAMDIFNTVD